ncbi:SLC13 family permease [Litoribrevibacter albus]|uniref:Transporter n=1 Tax=Litoribrevibacter albus TaxID=1473156 RepID=A0AA37SA62_9GAMM|nr:DASS family sodium-coupled anion symporter [Litoribrevibacter albus]GLQ32137.1 transporter [Litoribrevibacter albus]
MTLKQLISLSVILIVSALIYLSDLDPSIKKGLFIFSVAAILWMTESLHLTATALLIPVMSVALGVFPVNQALDSFSHPIVFIFLGGFSLATALRKQRLDEVIAHKILSYSKGHTSLAVYLLFALTAVLSMWVSNTAITAVMLPLALGIIASLKLSQGPTSIFVLLGIAYSASIGGMGSLVGSPPNAIVGAALNLTFLDWMKVGLPLVIILLPTLIFTLKLVVKPDLSGKVELSMEAPEASTDSKKVILIFIFTVLAWLLGKPLGDMLGVTKYFDAWVAITAVVALIVSQSLVWKDIEKSADWGVLLLFGGGLALSGVLKTTGTSAFIAESFASYMQGMPFMLFLVMVILFVIFLTELTSNTATAALLVPLFISISDQLGLPSEFIAMGIGLAASCAFMLPVATPPNAVVYGSGLVPQSQMMRAGIFLNLVASATLPFLLYLFL